MKKTLFLLVLVAASLLAANASPVTVHQAQSIARQFTSRPGIHLTAANATLELAQAPQSRDGVVDYYVFNRGTNAGWIIVSGDDRSIPVLGYSERGTWDTESLPDNARWWMEQYRQQMQYLRTHPDAARSPSTLSTSVEPLTTTTWKQSAPYNQEIPTSRFSLGTRRPLVGCVALAMAQVMKVHNWPTTGQGSHSYSWLCTNGSENATSTTTYSANFGATTYQWSSMKNSYGSSADATAVATLCYHCGVAVNMQYGVQASGAQIYDAAMALKTYFRYDKGLDLYLADFYNRDDWDALLRADLDQGLAIVYGGSTATGYGHCFVFDGYDTSGNFHINWGWGGNYDGWFVSSALNSGQGDYSTWQQAVLGIKPDQSGTSTGSSRPLTGYLLNFNATVASAAVGSSATLNIEGVTFLGEGPLSTTNWGVQILSADERTVIDTQWDIVQADAADGLEIGGTYSADDEAAMTVPSGIAEGTYHVRAIYTLDRGTTIARFQRPPVRSSYIKMVVSGGMAYFSEGDLDDPVTPEPVRGDVNGDGEVDVADVNAVVNILLGKVEAGSLAGNADLNGDGEIDVSDINAIVNIILGKE